jgi:hypothetical protein
MTLARVIKGQNWGKKTDSDLPFQTLPRCPFGPGTAIAGTLTPFRRKRGLILADPDGSLGYSSVSISQSANSLPQSIPNSSFGISDRVFRILCLNKKSVLEKGRITPVTALLTRVRIILAQATDIVSRLRILAQAAGAGSRTIHRPFWILRLEITLFSSYAAPAR